MTASEEEQRLQAALQSTAQEYAAVFDIDLQNEKQKISSQVDVAGRHLKEQQDLFDKTAATHREVLEEQLPQMPSHFNALQEQFDALDALEALVGRAAADVTRLEAAMTAAEQQLLDEAPTFTDRILQPVIRKLDPVPENWTRHIASFDSSLLFDPSHYLKNCTPSEAAVSASNEFSPSTSSGERKITNVPLPLQGARGHNSAVTSGGCSSQGYPYQSAMGEVNRCNDALEFAIEATDFDDRLCNLRLQQTRTGNVTPKMIPLRDRTENITGNKGDCIELLDEEEINTS